MNPKVITFVLFTWIFALGLVISLPWRAQVPGRTLSGTITDPSGTVVPNAQVVIKNSATGITTSLTTNAEGSRCDRNITGPQPGRDGGCLDEDDRTGAADAICDEDHILILSGPIRNTGAIPLEMRGRNRWEYLCFCLLPSRQPSVHKRSGRQLVATKPLPNFTGNCDHFAVDLKGKRSFVTSELMPPSSIDRKSPANSACPSFPAPGWGSSCLLSRMAAVMRSNSSQLT